jgi:hypothetical protein
MKNRKNNFGKTAAYQAIAFLFMLTFPLMAVSVDTANFAGTWEHTAEVLTAILPGSGPERQRGDRAASN